VAIQPLDRARGPDPSTLLRVILSLSMDELVEGLDCFFVPLRGTPRNDGLKTRRSADQRETAISSPASCASLRQTKDGKPRREARRAKRKVLGAESC